MPTKKTSLVLCAVRGGPESRNTVVRAIDLALEHNAHLTFLHILDAEFLGGVSLTMAPVRSIYQQLQEMGNFTMSVLCDRATLRGVAHVDYQVKSGNIKQLLHQAAVETHADIIVIGKPVRSPGSNVFTPQDFKTFIETLNAEIHPEIIVVSPAVSDPALNDPPHGIIPLED